MKEKEDEWETESEEEEKQVIKKNVYERKATGFNRNLPLEVDDDDED